MSSFWFLQTAILERFPSPLIRARTVNRHSPGLLPAESRAGGASAPRHGRAGKGPSPRSLTCLPPPVDWKLVVVSGTGDPVAAPVAGGGRFGAAALAAGVTFQAPQAPQALQAGWLSPPFRPRRIPSWEIAEASFSPPARARRGSGRGRRGSPLPRQANDRARHLRYQKGLSQPILGGPTDLCRAT